MAKKVGEEGGGIDQTNGKERGGVESKACRKGERMEESSWKTGEREEQVGRGIERCTKYKTFIGIGP